MVNIMPVKILVLLCASLLSACVTNASRHVPLNKADTVGPAPYVPGQQVVVLPAIKPRMDVIVPIFDPGLSEAAKHYEEDSGWPELRRAEANRFAYKLKQALDNTAQFSAVRVTPDKSASGDLYVLGEIVESDGSEVVFDIKVIDISGRQWLQQRFSHEVKASFYKNPRNKSKYPYAPVFKDVARAIAAILGNKSDKELDDLKYIADLRFGSSFNHAAFAEYMKVSGNHVSLISKPSDDDQMLKRISAIRVREQLFVDSLQDHYASFSQQMDDSYLKWQEASFTENQLHEKAQIRSTLQAVGGVLLLGLSVAAAITGNDQRSDAGKVTATSVATIGGLAGAWMLSSSFQSREEAKLHKDALDELGESLDLELATQVVSFEEKTVKLTGNAREQFDEWRQFLRRIYEQDTTPDTVL